MSDTASALPESVSALPVGTRLAEFEIKGLLGVGGFGIVYLAFDHALEREVAVKEYMPASMAGRTETLHVSLRSQSDAEVFALGLKSFVNEAKLLARFDHPSLIKVHRFWEANGTAYMAMPVLRGRTLKDIRRSTGRAPDEAWIRSTLVPLLGALELLHREGVYHRDIAPDNIHLEADGRPVLLDFGAARRVISGKTQTLTAILKPAYAPIEQYAETGAVKQGPWTDLYALGATLHFMLLGYPPAPATARTVSDEASELLSHPVAGVGSSLLEVVDWMLAPKPADRPQSVAALRSVLEGREPLPHRAGATTPPAAWDKTQLNSPITVPLGEEPRPDIELEDGRTGDAPIPAGRRATSGPAVPRTGGPGARRTAPDLPRTVAHTEPPAPQAARQPTPQRMAAAATDMLPVAADDAHRLPPPPARSRAVPLALAGLVVAGLIGYVAWARLAAPAPGMAAAPAMAASMPAPGLPGEPASGASAQAPATGSSEASTASGASALGILSTAQRGVATSAIDSPAAAGAGTTAGAAPVASSPAAAGAAPGRAAQAAPQAVPAAPRGGPPQPGERAVTQSPAGPSAANSPAERSGVVGAQASQATPPRPGAAAAAGVPPALASAAEPGPGATPEARCSGRNPLSHFVCMERECLRGRFKNHPECQAWRQQARPRDAAGN